MPALTKTHIAQIKIAQKALNMADDDYRDLLQRTAGVQSSTRLDTAGFAAVMAEFNRLGFESTAEHERRMQSRRAPGHATYAQKLKMQRLWDAWKGYPDKSGLLCWLKGKWGVENLKFMSGETATKAIGALLNFKKGDIAAENPETENHPTPAIGHSPAA
ncbi:MAG: regulatory protein GemA [Candidatus Latescibacteria bacterium]|nr:regulatory protein GemA [Candidatus Latescibacterota bacterium]